MWAFYRRMRYDSRGVLMVEDITFVSYSYYKAMEWLSGMLGLALSAPSPGTGRRSQ